MRLPRKQKKRLKKKGDWYYSVICMGLVARQSAKSIDKLNITIGKLNKQINK